MNTALFPKLQELYDVFSTTEKYAARRNQFAVVEVNRGIIAETLQNEPLTNEHLTGLIQMFNLKCTKGNFYKYLNQNVENQARRQEIAEKFEGVNQKSYTIAGLHSINKLTPGQLSIIKLFLQEAFQIVTIDEAITLCQDFDNNNIPYVTSGIYSPWLYYINPQLFPILNNTHNRFKAWVGFANDYPPCIKDFNELKTFLKEEDLGIIDMFAYSFKDDPNSQDPIELLNLNGAKLYKMSHGNLKRSGKAIVLEENNWITMGKYTGKRQADEFTEKVTIGDYVYVCYGGDELYCIGKVISDSEPLDSATDELIEGRGEWIRRTIEPLFYPNLSTLNGLKTEKRAFMPSGNSTFYEVPKDQLEFINEKIFIPNFNLKVIDSTVTGTKISVSISKKEQSPLNSILYGPPGTGKTFHSITHAVAIVENKTPEVIGSEDRKDVKARFDEYIREGQIVFCTFHQSMGYEDFIEGIKPVEPTSENEELSYAVQDGIFKKLCVEAAFSFVQQKPTAETKEIVDFSTQYDLYINFLHERLSKVDNVDLMTKSGGKIYIKNISPNNNIYVSHKESNKSYTISKTRLSKLSHAFPDLNEVENISNEFRAVIGGSNTSAYWAVLNGFRKYNSEHPGETVKEITDKRFSYDEKAEIIEALTEEDYKVETPKNFVIIIDEINRGNVSQIFGELITLIEDDKRLGKDESLTALLPYSKKRFGVPPNVYIIGTMNTADRSVEALDTALRRRFAFAPKMPEETKLQQTEDGIDLAAMLTSINNRIKVLKDADHTIGHAWLWNVKTVEDIQAVFGNKILPLLQEYFYNDFEKLGLVLGDNFFEQSLPISSTIFASFSGGNGLASQYDQTWQYQLKKPHELTVPDFQSLYSSTNKKVNEFQ